MPISESLDRHSFEGYNGWGLIKKSVAMDHKQPLQVSYDLF